MPRCRRWKALALAILALRAARPLGTRTHLPPDRLLASHLPASYSGLVMLSQERREDWSFLQQDRSALAVSLQAPGAQRIGLALP